MAGNPAPASDLQNILASLAQFAAAPTSNAGTSTPTGVEDHHVTAEATAGARSPAPATSSEPPSEAAASRVPDPRLRPQSRTATASSKPTIDPATITTWQEGLRCVTKIAAQTAQLAGSIQKMMADQRRHEMHWYAQRQALKQTQAARSSSLVDAHSILQSLNNGPSPEAPTNVEADKAEELAKFDRKIYAAQEAMEWEMAVEMKGLGIPFFGTRSELVVPDGDDVSKEQVPEGHPKWSLLVTHSELLALRRRMIEHLEDLYRE